MGITQKIIFTVTNDLNNDRRMIRICSALIEAGYEVNLVGFHRRNSKPLEERSFQTYRLPLLFQKGKLSYLEIWLRIFFYLLKQNYSIVCAIDMDTLPAVYMANKFKRKKIVFDAHEYFSEVPEVQNRKFTKTIWRNLESYFIPKIEKKYTVSEGLAAHMERLSYGKFDVILNVPLFNSHLNKIQKTKPIILYQGAINQGRGLIELINAIENIEIEAWIIGDGDCVEELTNHIKIIPWKQKVKYLGKKNVDELLSYTQQATIGYNVLEPLGLSYQVSLANKYFDYIQAEVPIITNDFKDYKNINSKFEVAFLIQSFTVEGIAFAIQKLLNDHDYYNALVNNCSRAKQEYNWENESQKLVHFYKNV